MAFPSWMSSSALKSRVVELTPEPVSRSGLEARLNGSYRTAMASARLGWFDWPELVVPLPLPAGRAGAHAASNPITTTPTANRPRDRRRKRVSIMKLLITMK